MMGNYRTIYVLADSHSLLLHYDARVHTAEAIEKWLLELIGRPPANNSLYGYFSNYIPIPDEFVFPTWQMSFATPENKYDILSRISINEISEWYDTNKYKSLKHYIDEMSEYY